MKQFTVYLKTGTSTEDLCNVVNRIASFPQVSFIDDEVPELNSFHEDIVHAIKAKIDTRPKLMKHFKVTRTIVDKALAELIWHDKLEYNNKSTLVVNDD